MNRFAGAAVLVAAMTTALPSQAAITTKQFLELYGSTDGEGLGELQIAAMEQGLQEINSYLAKTRKEKPVYCQPEHLALTGSQLADMVARGVAENPKLDDMPLSASLLMVLEKTFPCPQN